MSLDNHKTDLHQAPHFEGLFYDILCRSQTHCTGKQYANEKAESGDKDLLKFIWALNLFHIN